MARDDGPQPKPPTSNRKRRGRAWVIAAAVAAFTTAYGGFFLLLVGAVLIVLAALGDRGTDSPLFVLGLLVVANALGGLGYVGMHRAKERADLYEREEQAAKASVDEALEQLGETLDLADLLRLNSRQMEAYEALTRRQAESSYRLSHIALGAGLVVVIGGAAVAILADHDAAKIAGASLAALATAVSGFIASTYLRIYEKTLAQLNYYFEQPLISSYVLTAERLIERMTNEPRKDDAIDRLVQQLSTAIGSLAVRASSPNASPDLSQQRRA